MQILWWHSIWYWSVIISMNWKRFHSQFDIIWLTNFFFRLDNKFQSSELFTERVRKKRATYRFIVHWNKIRFHFEFIPHVMKHIDCVWRLCELSFHCCAIVQTHKKSNSFFFFKFAVVKCICCIKLTHRFSTYPRSWMCCVYYMGYIVSFYSGWICF